MDAVFYVRSPRPLDRRPAALRPAASLLEVLVVVALMAVLAGLLLGGIQKVRTSAERTRCQNQLKQLGLALHLYHEGFDRFPPGTMTDRTGEPMPYLSWCARLLPYLDHEPLWREVQAAFRRDRNFLNEPAHPHLGTLVLAFNCPSDERVRTAHALGPNGVRRAFTSYLGVNGRNANERDGTLFADSRVRLADILDGTSNTLAVGERPPSADLIFGWWYAGWGQDHDGEADMLLGVRSYNTGVGARGCPPGPYEFQPGRFDNQCDAFHFWSPHPGGANFVFCDGSVRFLRYSANPTMPALATRAGGEAVQE